MVWTNYSLLTANQSGQQSTWAERCAHVQNQKSWFAITDQLSHMLIQVFYCPKWKLTLLLIPFMLLVVIGRRQAEFSWWHTCPLLHINSRPVEDFWFIYSYGMQASGCISHSPWNSVADSCKIESGWSCNQASPLDHRKSYLGTPSRLLQAHCGWMPDDQIYHIRNPGKSECLNYVGSMAKCCNTDDCGESCWEWRQKRRKEEGEECQNSMKNCRSGGGRAEKGGGALLSDRIAVQKTADEGGGGEKEGGRKQEEPTLQWRGGGKWGVSVRSKQNPSPSLTQGTRRTMYCSSEVGQNIHSRIPPHDFTNHSSTIQAINQPMWGTHLPL